MCTLYNGHSTMTYKKYRNGRQVVLTLVRFTVRLRKSVLVFLLRTENNSYNYNELNCC